MEEAGSGLTDKFKGDFSLICFDPSLAIIVISVRAIRHQEGTEPRHAPRWNVREEGLNSNRVIGPEIRTMGGGTNRRFSFPYDF